MKILKRAALTMLLAIFAIKPSVSHAQGSLTPPGAPAPTMKTLDQIETRTPISGLPYTISTPGSYYVTTNLLVAVNDGIVIKANNVTLDLNGFTISSVQNPVTTGKAIALGSGSGPVANVTIRNGFITGNVTNNGSAFGGSGFGYGIVQFGGLPSVNVHVSGVTVSGCLYVGIHLGSSNTVVESCSVNSVGSYGIYAQTVSGSTAMNCGIYGIYATDSANNCSGAGVINGSGVYAVMANNCHGTGSGSGSGVIATNANNCIGNAPSTGTGLSCRIANNCNCTSVSGNGLVAITAINCSGTSTSGIGISATTAQSCYGSSSSISGVGIYATTAINCSGSGGNGISANTALNCNGSSTSQAGTGIYVTSAQNCYGTSSSYGIGIYAKGTAVGCSGYSFGDTGMYAFIGNACHGTGPTPSQYDHNVNSF